jgi:Tfp pilus assembly PilM family ATPase
MIQLIINDFYLVVMESKSKGFEEIRLPQGTVVDGKIQNKQRLVDILTVIARKRKWKRPTIQLALPDEAISIRMLMLPQKLEGAALRAHVWMELGTHIHLPMDRPLFEVLPLDMQGTHHRAVLYAVSADVLEVYEDVLKTLKWMPVVATISATGIYTEFRKRGNWHQRLVNEKNLDEDSDKNNQLERTDNKPRTHFENPILYVQVDPGKLNIGIFHHDTLVFHHQLMVDEVTKQSVTRLHIEIERMLQFYAQQATLPLLEPGFLLLAGEEALKESWFTSIQEHFDCPIYVPIETDYPTTGAVLAMGHSHGSELNFWPEQTTKTALTKMMVGACLVACMGTIVSGYFVVQHVEKVKQTQQLALQSLDNQIALLQVKTTQASNATGIRTQVTEWLMQQKQSSADLLQHFSGLLPDQAMFLQFNYTDDRHIDLSVSAANREDAVHVYAKLKADDRVAQVVWTSLNRENMEMPDTRYLAELKVQLKAPEAERQVQ